MTTLPDSLVRFEDELEQAIRRDRARRPRRLAVRLSAAGVAAAAVALGILSILPGGGPSAVDRAAAALAVKAGTILHIDMTGRQLNPDGSVATWEDESWQQESKPFGRRQVETSSDAPRAETATVDGVQQLYDPATDTIYTTPPQLPPVVAKPAPSQPGTALSPDEAERLRSAQAEKRAKAESAKPAESPFRDEILSLLRSGGAHEAGHATVGDRDALRIESADGRTTYLVDASSYDPIRLVTVNGGARTTLDFRVYELLDAAGNDALVSLAAQHPGAAVDETPGGWAAASARLYPHG